ncbi:hypothetical protein [Pelomonas sp. SE-A7]|uniref:hypothetical protein n=1 Tax=Pelomonas sp. SE-A7 TaxID=3054953 RepID=UPI00259C74F6|nr:hypothetical protein [Pelomonas sp. SE-A7]MDM4766120.1 hypothetical protein [Pelomonas sp. SE-A7]
MKPVRPLLLIALLVPTLALAQFPPGGGMGGGGKGGMGGRGGNREGGERRAPADKPAGQAEQPRAPEPLKLWHEKLGQLEATLALQANQVEAWAALMRDLRDLADLNERRRARVMGFARPPVSAVTDIDRDLRLEQESLADQAAAYGDLRRFHQKLKELLSEEQYRAVLEAYRASQAAPRL